MLVEDTNDGAYSINLSTGTVKNLEINSLQVVSADELYALGRVVSVSVPDGKDEEVAIAVAR